jgi:hypothetical protein
LPRNTATLQNWLLGGAEKKFRMLRVVLGEADREWGEEELADQIEAGRTGSLDEHLEILVQIGLAEKVAPRRYKLIPYGQLPDHLQDVRDALDALLTALEYVSADQVVRPNQQPRRTRG